MIPGTKADLVALFKAKNQNKLTTNTSPVQSGVNTCQKCQSKRVILQTQQTRSFDEPLTTFYQCTDCDKAWKA